MYTSFILYHIKLYYFLNHNIQFYIYNMYHSTSINPIVITGVVNKLCELWGTTLCKCSQLLMICLSLKRPSHPFAEFEFRTGPDCDLRSWRCFTPFCFVAWPMFKATSPWDLFVFKWVATVQLIMISNLHHQYVFACVCAYEMYHMYVYIHIYMRFHVYIYVYIYIHMWLHIYIYIHIHTCICMYMYM